METPIVVVVGADLGVTGDEAIRVGLEQLAHGTAQGMYVVHVLGAEPSAPADAASTLDAESIKVLAESLASRIDVVAKREQLPYYAELVRVELRTGSVQRALIDAAREHHAELLIIGTHGRAGVDRLLAGSIAETLVRHASCSVLVARPRVQARKSVRESVAHRDYSTYRFDAKSLSARESHEQHSEDRNPDQPQRLS